MTEQATGYRHTSPRPALVVAAAVLGVVLGAFLAFTWFAVFSLSTSAAFTFDPVGAIAGAAGMALGALIIISAIALLWGRMRSVLVLSCAIAILPIVWAIAVGALGGLFTLMGLAALVLAGLIIIFAAGPATSKWLLASKASRTPTR